MKRDGGIIILVLILTSVTLTAMIYILEIVVLQSRLVENRKDNIQAELAIEGKIASLIYEDEEFTNKIKNLVLFNKNPNSGDLSMTMDIDTLENESANIIFEYCEDGKLIYNLTVKGDLNRVKETMRIKGHVFNQVVDHCENGLITLNNKSLDYLEELSSLLSNTKSGFNEEYASDFHLTAYNFPENNILIWANKLGDNCKVYFIGENAVFEDNASNGEMIVFKEYDGFNRDEVRIEKASNVAGDGFLEGIIYLENGDLVFSGDIQFGGIIILENGSIICEGDSKVLIYGKVILNNFNLPGKGISTRYSHDYMRLMSRFLPGFISPTIDSIR